MNKALRGAVGAAIVLGVALIGLQVLGGGVGWPGPSPSPAVIREGEALAGGRYMSVTAPNARFQVDLSLPANWTPRHVSSGEVSLVGPDGAPHLGFFSVTRVYRDPCHPADFAGGYALGISNSRDVVDELRNFEGFETGPISTLRIGGLRSTSFVISNSIDTEAAVCTRRTLRLFKTGEAVQEQEASVGHPFVSRGCRYGSAGLGRGSRWGATCGHRSAERE